MWSEVLRIIPKIVEGDLNKEEKKMMKRFGRIAGFFKKSLKLAISGSVAGIGLALISKLLDPVEALEEKIKNLLGEGQDLSDMAERFGTDAGSLRRLQDVSRSVGVEPDQLRDLMTKFAESVEKAREELANPNGELSASTDVVRNFAGEKDLANGFFQFLQSLKSQSPEIRANAEKQIFGEKQFGGGRRLIETDFASQFSKLGIAGNDKYNKAYGNLANVNKQDREATVKRDSEDFLRNAAIINGKMIDDINQAEKLRMERESKQLESYNDLKKSANSLEELKNLFTQLMTMVTKMLGYLADIVGWVKKMGDSRVARGLISGLFTGGR